MNMKQKLMGLYKTLLSLGSLSVSEDGFVSIIAAKGENRPATIKGKRLVIPNEHQLDMPGWDKRIAFHPIRESLNGGPSDVLNEFKTAITIRLDVTIGHLMKWLLDKGASQAEQKLLTPEQSEVLSIMSTIDKATVEKFAKLLESVMGKKPTQKFVNIYLKRPGKHYEKQYSKVGVVSFPFYEELCRETGAGDIWGTKIRAKEREIFKGLMEYILPAIADTEAYNHGTNSRDAPYLEALVRSAFKVVADLSNVLQLFKEPMGVLWPVYAFDEDLNEWESLFDDPEMLSQYAKLIPTLSGNESSFKVEEEKAEEDLKLSTTIAPVSNAVIPQLQQVGQQPSVQQAPVRQGRVTLGVPPKGGLAVAKPTTPQPQVQPQVMAHQAPQPQVQNNLPWNVVPQVNTVPNITDPTDFRAIVASNPAFSNMMHQQQQSNVGHGGRPVNNGLGNNLVTGYTGGFTTGYSNTNTLF